MTIFQVKVNHRANGMILAAMLMGWLLFFAPVQASDNARQDVVRGSQCVVPADSFNRWQWPQDNRQFTLNGSAVSAAEAIQLTDSAKQAGSAFWRTPYPLYASNGKPRSFSTAFRFRISHPSGISDRDGQGGDGLTFVINASDQDVGGRGGGLGRVRFSAR